MWRNRVVWSEGLFLRPQHFQQQQRAFDHALDAHTKATAPFVWGFDRVTLDENALSLGIVQLNSGAGLLPDGTPFSFPDHDAPPLPLEIGNDVKDQRVMLAIPFARPGLPTVSLNAPRPDALTRFTAASTDAPDENEDYGQDAPVQLARLALRLVLERDASGAYATIPLARVVERRADGQIVLDQHFIPTSVNATTQRTLRGFVTELLGLVRQRGEVLAARISAGGRGGVAEVADFLLLQLVNRTVGTFEHLAGLPLLHPERLYAIGVALAHEMATFGPDRRLARGFGAYDHDDLQRTFQPVMVQLRLALSMVLEQNAIQIELHDRKYGVRVAIMPDAELLRTASFVLAVNAQMPGEQLRARFPTQVKIGPVEKIRDLVNLQLPGVTLRALPVAPRQIPYHAGFNYFELDTKNELWGMLERSGGLAMHLSGQFPGIELEFWAIRG